MVRPLRAAGIGVKKIITHLKQSHPNLKVGSREVREALRQLDEAANDPKAPADEDKTRLERPKGPEAMVFPEFPN